MSTSTSAQEILHSITVSKKKKKKTTYMYLLHSVASIHTNKEMVQTKVDTIGCYSGLLLGFCHCCVEALSYITWCTTNKQTDITVYQRA